MDEKLKQSITTDGDLFNIFNLITPPKTSRDRRSGGGGGSYEIDSAKDDIKT